VGRLKGPKAGGSAGNVTRSEALVVGAHGRHVLLEMDDGTRTLAHPRGKRSNCVVGDRVRWAPAGDEAVVEAVLDRRNVLSRQDEFRTKTFAANIDQLLVLVAGEPPFSESQLTRALIATEDAGIAAVIALNKIDLPAAEVARQRLAPYVAMGYPVIEVSVKTQPDAARDCLDPLLADKSTLLLGPSGTGKSSLINLMIPAVSAQVGEISLALNAGRHTTTTTTWYWLDDTRRGALLDSPGFQEFGLHHIEPERLALLMPDIRQHLGHCRFHNCTHRHEPGCGVREAASAGQIAPNRVRLYEALWEELSQPPRY